MFGLFSLATFVGYLAILLMVSSANVGLKDDETTVQAQLRRHHHHNYHKHNHQGCHDHGRQHGRHHGDCDYSGSMDYSALLFSTISVSTMSYSIFDGASEPNKERPCRRLIEQNEGSISFSGDSGLSGDILLTLSYEMPDEMTFE